MKGSYDVIFTSSNAIAPFPRLERAARCLVDAGLRCLAVGWDREKRHPTQEEIDKGVTVIRKHLRGGYGWGWRNVWGLLCWNLWLLFYLIKMRPLVIHAYDFDTIVPALIVKKFSRCKVVYDIADWYAESRKVGWLKPLIERVERWACRKVDLVILPHEARLQQVGFIPQRWLVIYNSPFDCLHSLQYTHSSSLSGDYFAYVGVLQPDRGIEQIIKAASSAGAKIILAGFGPLEAYCRRAASTKEGIEFLGKIPYERTLALESNAIAIIALYDPRLPNNRLAAPNKLYEAMMLGRSLITNKGTLVSELVEKERIGITVTYGDVQELSQALDRLRANPKECAEMGYRARMLYERQYSFSKQCEKLQQAYQDLCLEHFAKLRREDK